MPSPTSSPWIRRCTQVEFSRANRITRSRITEATRGRPRGGFVLGRVGPAPSDQLPVPAQQRRRSHDSRPQHLARQHPCERGQQKPVPRLQPRTTHLPTQHRNLMPQHQQLEILPRLATTAGHHKREQHPEHRVQSGGQHPNDHAEPSRYGGAEVIEPHRPRLRRTSARLTRQTVAQCDRCPSDSTRKSVDRACTGSSGGALRSDVLATTQGVAVSARSPGIHRAGLTGRARGRCGGAPGTRPRVPVRVPFRTQHPLGAVVNRPSVWSDR